ncbi:MAG: hypothetical protein QXH10_09990 [Ignisphaera sp.]
MVGCLGMRSPEHISLLTLLHASRASIRYLKKLVLSAIATP